MLLDVCGKSQISRSAARGPKYAATMTAEVAAIVPNNPEGTTHRDVMYITKNGDINTLMNSRLHTIHCTICYCFLGEKKACILNCGKAMSKAER